MSVSSTAASTPRPEPAPVQPVAVGEIDASCRWPVMYLLGCAAFWLVIALGLGLLASVKLHGPALLAECPPLTYGRVQPASLNLMLYGFAIQASLAVALWMLARLGRTHLVHPWLALLGGKFWNLGVLVGMLGILAGGGTGFEGLEMPRYALGILFVAYTVIGVSALLTWAQRREPQLYVSQWFLFAALLWFPWIFSTASLLLVFQPVRGILQSAIHWWYLHNLTSVCLGFTGLGILFYLVPRLAGRPLYSRYLAMFAFWVLALVSGLGGVHAGAPLPAWMPGLGTVAGVFAVVGAIAIGQNLLRTLHGSAVDPRDAATRRLVVAAVAGYVVAVVLTAAGSFKSVSGVTHFTLFTAGLRQLWLTGFFMLTIFGATNFIIPRLMNRDWPSAGLLKLQFGAALAGVAIQIVPLLVGGVIQGRKLQDTSIAFLDASRSSLMFLRLSTLGDLLLLVAGLALLANFGLLVAKATRERWMPVIDEATRTQPAEVKA